MPFATMIMVTMSTENKKRLCKSASPFCVTSICCVSLPPMQVGMDKDCQNQFNSNFTSTSDESG